jgi:serine/threonine protein kinase
MTEAWKQWEGEIVDRRFRLQRFLGASDHSAVFLTEYSQPPQKVALKFVETNPATAQLQLSRWERAAKLSHPHLIRLLQGGRCQLGRASMLYVVTELAEENLSQILPSRALTPNETEFMLRSVLEVLAYLHAQGLMHGHLKPANILAVAEQLKVSSDGICAAGERRLGGGQPSVYDPPEISTSGFSPAGDVWSLGITLVEVLTQRPSVGEGIRHGDPLLPETVPAPFLEIARQCLRLDALRRWTVPDIAARLLPTSPAPRRKRAITGYALPVAAALVLLLAGSRLLNHHPQTPPGPEIATRPESRSPDTGKNPPDQIQAHDPASKPPDSRARARAAVPVPATAPPALRPSSRRPATAFVAGAVAQQVIPKVSQRSRNTIHGKIRVGVRVAVDSSGNVVEANLDSPGPSLYFANLALEASRHWKFTPPQTGNDPLASEWILRFAFGRETTEALPTQVSP